VHSCGACRRAWETTAGEVTEDTLATVRDKRQNRTTPWGYVVFHDTFLSGWGDAPGRSFYALAVDNQEEAERVEENGLKRSDMRDPGLVQDFLDNGAPDLRLEPGDHLCVVDKHEAPRWYREDTEW
jgi:hypothetical protein